MILECKKVREQILKETDEIIEKENLNLLTRIIRVEGDAPSEKYVRGKVKTCNEHKVNSEVVLLPNNVTNEELIAEIEKANNDNNVTSILLQLPLPKHIDEYKAINTIKPEKDVDGLTTLSVGKLFEGDKDEIIPCTPYGIMKIFDYYNIDLEGKDVLIINRSMLVGKPLIELFQRKNATVTLAHSKTKDVHTLMITADIIITAVGIKDFISECELIMLDNYASFHKINKYIIDVSINIGEDGKLYGDVTKTSITSDKPYEFINSLKNLYVTPVPNGIGPLTTASLIANTIQCNKIQQKEKGWE